MGAPPPPPRPVRGLPGAGLLSSVPAGAPSKLLVTSTRQISSGVTVRNFCLKSRFIYHLPKTKCEKLGLKSCKLGKWNRNLFGKIRWKIVDYLQRYFFWFGTEWGKLPFPDFPRLQKRRIEEKLNETVKGKSHFVRFVNFGKILQSIISIIATIVTPPCACFTTIGTKVLLNI